MLVHGQLVRRFYRSGAGARSLTEVVASGIKKLDPVVPPSQRFVALLDELDGQQVKQVENEASET